MTMRIHKFWCYLSLIAFISMTGCMKDTFLDKQPTGKITNDQFWTSKKDAELALAGCYSALRTPAFAIDNSSYSSLQFEGLTDNAYCNSTLDNYTNISRGLLTPTTGGIQSRVWKDAYIGIAHCNWFLGNLDKVPDLTDEDRGRMQGEAYFLRSFLYNELTMLYGDVPLVLEALGYDQSVFELTKTSKEQIVQQIIKDLDAAASSLPNTAYTDGHPVRGSALALKARICLYNGLWSDAAQSAKTVMDEGKFSLADSYQGIFWGEQQNNPEIMFSIQSVSPNATHNLDLLYGSRFAMVPLHTLVDAYEMRDGSQPKPPVVPSYYDPNDRMQNSFYQNRDPRLKLTIFTPGDPWAYNPEKGFNNTEKFKAESPSVNNLGIRKYINLTVNDGNGGPQGSSQDIVKLRYADVLLMYAEAKVEMDGGATSDPDALKAINAVRARPGVDMPAKNAPLTRATIRNERRVELAFEGLRYYDIKRWKIAGEVLNGVKDPGGVVRKFEDKFYYWPIPQTEVDKMGPDFQNPDYQ